MDNYYIHAHISNYNRWGISQTGGEGNGNELANIEKYFQSQRTQFLKSLPKNKTIPQELKDLEEQLTLLLDADSSDTEIQQERELLEQLLSESAKKSIKLGEYGSVESLRHKITDAKIQYISSDTNNKNYMTWNQLQTQYNKIIETVKSLKQSNQAKDVLGVNYNKLMKAAKNFENFYKELEKQSKDNGGWGKTKRIAIYKNKGIYKQLCTIAEILALPSTTTIGNVVELGGLICVGNGLGYTGKKLEEWVKKEISKGSNGMWQGNVKQKITIDTSELSKIFNENELKDAFSLESSNNGLMHKIDIKTGAAVESQGKSDLTISINTDVTYPISMKNYYLSKDGYMSLVSNTSLLALLQKVNLDFIAHFLNVTSQHTVWKNKAGDFQDNDNSPIAQQAYRAAFRALRVILLYYAMAGRPNGNQAEYILINDSSGKSKNQVKIIDINELVRTYAGNDLSDIDGRMSVILDEEPIYNYVTSRNKRWQNVWIGQENAFNKEEAIARSKDVYKNFYNHQVKVKINTSIIRNDYLNK